MLDFLYDIKGPDFLLYYYVFSMAILLIGWLITKIDSSRVTIELDPSSFSYIELAYIRGGVKAVISVILFEMWRSEYVEMHKRRRAIAFMRKEDENPDFKDDFNRSIWTYLRKIALYKDIVKDNSDRFMSLLAIQIAKFKRLGLIFDEEGLNRYRHISLLSLIVALFPGVVKLLMGIQHNKPVLFLILELVAVLLVYYYLFVRNKPHLTRIGKRIYKKVKQRYDWLKTKANVSREEELIGVAVFGVTRFKNTSNSTLLFPDTYDRTSNWIWFGGCSGCGCSGGCSGGEGCSSCSGGCGGGCGGCGGD